jgi:hypothetical protein
VAAVGCILVGLALAVTTNLVVAGPAGAKSHKKAQSSCSAFKAGKNGIVRTFCSGSASATVTANGSTTTIKGGTCGKSGNYFTVNVGVVISPSYKGSKPNYFGLDVPPTATSFTNAILAYAVKGTSGYATSNSGTVVPNHKSGSFSGTDLEGKAVSGTFTC